MYLRVVLSLRSDDIGIFISTNVWVLVFYGCSNKLPQSWWLKTTVYFFTDLEARNPKSLSQESCCQYGLPFFRDSRGESFPSLFLLRWLLALLDFWLHQYSLYFLNHTVFSSSAYVKSPSS